MLSSLQTWKEQYASYYCVLINFNINYFLSDCTAPFGSFIRVEFRDQFSLEESDTCEYDRLEIRNGQFGYSDILDVICGHNFPPEISSTDRYLWLRFKSDESIEYAGFRAVYHFIPLPTTRPEPPPCFFERTGHSGVISAQEIPDSVYEYYQSYKTPIECIWNITVNPGWQMYLSFMDYGLAKPNDCDVNYIDIYENILSEEKRKVRFCGTMAEPQKSDGNVINVRIYVKEGVIDKPGLFKFIILFTAFRTNERLKCNEQTEFDCDDGTCIDISLKCNEEPNCKYRYDEDQATTCLVGGKGVLILTSDHMIVILIVFFALVIGMCASIIVSCWGKIKERRQRELEYKLRRSRETSMEAGLDRTMTVTSLDKNLEFPGNLAHSSHLPQVHPITHQPITPQLNSMMHHLAHTKGSSTSLHMHRSHPKLASIGPVASGSSQDPVIRSDEDDEDEDDEVDNECYEPDDVCLPPQHVLSHDSDTRHGLNLYRPTSNSNIMHTLPRDSSGIRETLGMVSGSTHSLHRSSHTTSTGAAPHDSRSLHHRHPSMDEEEDYSSNGTPPIPSIPQPQIISINCPLYHQHQQQAAAAAGQLHHRHQQEQQQRRPESVGRSRTPVLRERRRSGSESPIPPPPPPPAVLRRTQGQLI